MIEKQYKDIKTEITTIIHTILTNENNPIECNIDNTVVHLTTTVIRLKSKNYIPLSYNQTTLYKEHPLYSLANKVCNELEKLYCITFPNTEITYLTMYLANQTVLDNEFNIELDLLNKDTINIVEESIKLIQIDYPDTSFDASMLSALGLHIQQAIHRLIEGSQVENPIKDQIMENYPLETTYSSYFNQIIHTMYDLSLNLDELAFITMHLASKR